MFSINSIELSEHRYLSCNTMFSIDLIELPQRRMYHVIDTTKYFFNLFESVSSITLPICNLINLVITSYVYVASWMQQLFQYTHNQNPFN